MRIIFTFWLICFFFSGFSQQKNYETSKIIDTIWVDEYTKESFSLYLPNNYKPSELFPVVFIFDPGGRGKTGIYPFIKASEKYGYILICSNNSKNGPYNKNYEIANRLFNSVFTNFNINEKRIYTSGFSGGSRLASSIAILTTQIQGVIACGAGLESKDGIVANQQNFSYAAIVGNRDMNYKEMINTRDFLNKFKVSNELFVFDIKHQWPTQEQILNAFDWLQLQAYKKNILLKNEEKINTIYHKIYKVAKQHQEDNRLLLSADAYKRIVRNFSRFYNLDSIKIEMKTLINSKAYRTEKKELETSFAKENTLTTMFIDQFTKDFERSKMNKKWWSSKINKIRKELETSSQTEKKMYNRLLYKIFAHAIETAGIGNRIQDTNQSILCYEICILIYPKYPLPYLKQIENYLVSNDEKTALNYLEKLINHGFTNRNRIDSIKGIDKLKKNDRFEEILNQLN